MKAREQFDSFLRNLPRMWDWSLLTVALFAMVAWLAPQQLNVVLYKALLVSIAAVMTYWVDHSLRAHFIKRLAENGAPADTVVAAIIVSRALIFLGCALGMTLGL